eukprot:7384222-Prymnesium_polylepis.3
MDSNGAWYRRSMYIRERAISPDTAGRAGGLSIAASPALGRSPPLTCRAPHGGQWCEQLSTFDHVERLADSSIGLSLARELALGVHCHASTHHTILEVVAHRVASWVRGAQGVQIGCRRVVVVRLKGPERLRPNVLTRPTGSAVPLLSPIYRHA